MAVNYMGIWSLEHVKVKLISDVRFHGKIEQSTSMNSKESKFLLSVDCCCSWTTNETF